MYRLSKQKNAQVCRVYCHTPSIYSSASCWGKSVFVWCHMVGTNQLNTCQWWNGLFFGNDSLQNLGLCYQLGHTSTSCPFPQAGPKNFLVFNMSGPHFITIDYCNCSDKPLKNQTQLLHEQWFPVTLSCLQTVSHSIASKHSTNLHCKARLVFMTTTTRSCDDLIMLAFPNLL